MNKKVSVIMSVCNEEKKVSASIESILNQTYKNFEFLILDDGSTDSTYQILKDFENKDQRIKIYQNTENIGLTKSLNFLASKSKGSILARQDADDLSLKNRFSVQTLYLDKFDAVVSRARIQGTNNKVPGFSFYIPSKIIRRFKNPHIHGTLMINKKIFQSIGGYDENFKYAQDFKLFIDFWRDGYRVKNLNEVLYILNMKDNISTKFKKEQEVYFRLAKSSRLK